MDHICSVNHRQHLQIHWNSSNLMFNSLGIVTVYLGDLIDFICPYYDDQKEYSTDQIEYNTLYLVNENDYNHCNTTNYHPLFKCTKPFDIRRCVYTLSISRYLPYPNLPEFDNGEFYYFISTSSGRLSSIDQRSEGLCQTKNMKLILNVQKSFDESKRRRPIIAKRLNLTFLDLDERFDSFSSRTTSRNISLTLLLLVCCLLLK